MNQKDVIYQIYPRSFKDSNGDGIGDLKGIISELDYLKDLGIDAIWLSPVYKSPLDDMGYDVADYYSIHEDYGTMEDMDLLIQEAKKRNIKIIMDLVVNHTSDEHEWFIKSKDKDSPYHDYYIYKKGKGKNPPNNWTSMFTGSAWEYVPEIDEYYLHLYSKKQPDLNWHNPKVIEEVEKIITFWLDKGVYGFRCDVINQIYKESFEDGKGHAMSGRGMEHYLMKEGNHQILRKFYDDIFSKRDCVVIGETFNVDYSNGKRFLDNHEMDMFFIFDHMDVDKSYNPLIKKRFSSKKFMKIIYKWQDECSWMANYLENHDQRRSITRFGDSKSYWKESGKMLALLNLTLRGTSFIYQGEEIGMLDYPYIEKKEEYRDVAVMRIYDIAKGFKIFSKSYIEKFLNQFNRDHARSPMQWDDSLNGGFSTSSTCWLPANPNYVDINVKKEKEDEDSILNFYKALLKIKKDHDALTLGSFHKIETKDPIYAFIRKYEGEEILTIFNFSKKKAKLPDYLSDIEGELLLSNFQNNDQSYLLPYEGRLIKIS